MKLIFFSFKHRYRNKELNNLLNSRVYGKYLLLNLSGPIKYIIAKLLLFLKIGKAISCDGRPVINHKLRGINLWMRGTNLDITANCKNLDNNFETIYNPFIKNQKIFYLYPTNIKKKKIKTDYKIVHMSRVDIKTTTEEKDIWNRYKNQLMEDYSLVDNKIFLNKILNNHDDERKKFELYKKIKLLLRFEIIKELKKKFENNISLIGDDWSEYYKDSTHSVFDTKKISNIYAGNIGLDLGSLAGSTSLYPRSIQIIESGGLIIQNIQSDSKKIWGELQNKVLFNNSVQLITLVEKLLDNKKYCHELLEEIFENFSNSNEAIEKNLDNILENEKQN
ncbi:hypothetical protein N8745_03650 [Candidatus Pelagibacter sp.]|nr:hypothetical protein [Candidatus Pelagibacter sp.]